MKSIWIILFDTSFSMSEPIEGGRETFSRLDAAKQIIQTELLDVGDNEVALVQFATDSRVLFRDKGEGLTIRLSEIDNIVAAGSTNLRSAFKTSLRILRSDNYSSVTITLLTDGDIRSTRGLENIIEEIAVEFPSIEINTKILGDLGRRTKYFFDRISINGRAESIESVGELSRALRYDKDRYRNRASKKKRDLSDLGVGSNDIIISITIPFKGDGVEVVKLVEILDLIDGALYRSDVNDISQFFNQVQLPGSDTLREIAVNELGIYKDRRFRIIHSSKGSLLIIGVVTAVSIFVLKATIGKSLERGYENSEMDIYLSKVFKELFNGKFRSVFKELKKVLIKEDENVDLSIERDSTDKLTLIELEVHEEQKEKAELPSYEEILKDI